MANTSYEQIKAVTLKLLAYCQANDWAGYDPYDALNSEIFKALPFLDFKLFRLGLTQLMKRLPFNIRPLLLVPKTQNPKAIALFLTAFLKLKRLGLLEDESLIGLMIEKLINLRSPSTLSNPSNPNNPSNSSNNYWCWGYSFPWQTRTILVPRGAPNLVCTSFVANALLDAYEENRKPPYLSMAVNAAEYILDDLYWTDGDSVACFSYPLPSSRARVHNANFLGAALLCRIYKHSGEKRFLEPALRVARYSASKQQEDGSWDYGESPTQHWRDNFHTGYNLCALQSISQNAETSEFEPHIRRGFEFYRKHFFTEDGAPKYFHDRTFPLDIHSVAQSIITLLTFEDLYGNNVSLAHAVSKWATTNMWDEQGYFYYQVSPFFKNKISYMRWSQAWMVNALATFLDASGKRLSSLLQEQDRIHRLERHQVTPTRRAASQLGDC
jgi:hypothetical protein